MKQHQAADQIARILHANGFTQVRTVFPIDPLTDELGPGVVLCESKADGTRLSVTVEVLS